MNETTNTTALKIKSIIYTFIFVHIMIFDKYAFEFVITGSLI